MNSTSRQQAVTKPTIAVIICAYTLDRWDDLVCAVESAQAQTLPPSQIVVVIDHNPALLERAGARFPELWITENVHANGLSGARNSGIAASESDYIAFLDDDAVAEADWLEKLAYALNDPQVLGVGGRILPNWATEAPGWFPEEFLWVVGCSHRGLPTEAAEIRNLVGASMLIRRSVFEQVGGFRADMGRVGTIPLGCEETELCIRARQRFSGARFMYEPHALVYHTVPAKRARWSYFQARCYAEGVSKSLVSRLVGSKDGLSAERAHAFVTLPKGVLRAVSAALFHRDRNGWGRAAAMSAGLFITGVGYLRGASDAPGSAQRSERAARAPPPHIDGLGAVLPADGRDGNARL